MATSLRTGGNVIKEQVVNVSPTLIIGLGGSGKEVLMRLRKLFYTNTRSTGLPIIEYLWIDTDIRRQDIMGKDYDAISNQLYLPESDIIDATVEPKAVREYFDRSNRYENIFSWLHGSISQLGDMILVNGAGQVRPCGRLAFFNHFKDIRSRIKRKLEKITDQSSIQKVANRFAVNPKPNIFLIASVAGGTGSGMFLDTAFLLRSIEPNIFPTGILFLPSLFDRIGGTDDSFKSKIHGNAYAALKELDYYMAPNVGISPNTGKFPTFTFNWDGNNEVVTAPPFGNVYFLDGKNSSGKHFSEITEITQMAAEFLYLEYTKSQFGDEKRSIRSNVASFLIDETWHYEADRQGAKIYSQYFPNRYSSFGISSIKLDIPRMRNAASYYWARELADYWRSEVEQNALTLPDRTDVKNVFSLSGQVGRFLTVDIIRENYLRNENNDSLMDMNIDGINNSINEITDRISESFDRKTPESMLTLYRDELTGDQGVVNDIFEISTAAWRRLLEVADEKLGPNGEDYIIIEENAERIYKELESACSIMLRSFIANPRSRGIPAAMEFLRLAWDILSGVSAREFGDEPERPRTFPLCRRVPDIPDTEIELYKKYAIEGKNIKVQPFSKTAARHYQDALEARLRKFLSGIEEGLNGDTAELRSKLVEWYRTRYGNVVANKTRNILDSLLHDIETWQASITKYNEGLSELSSSYHAFCDAFRNRDKEIRNIHINMNTDDAWFREHIERTLKPKHPAGVALSWNDLLDRETELLFSQSIQDDGSKVSFEKIVPDNMQPAGGINRAWGFDSLYSLISDRAAMHGEWLSFRSFVDRFAFVRMDGFLDDKNADTEFQEKSSNRQQDLEKVTGLADSWISRSAIDPHQGPNIRYIGIPSDGNTTTSTEAKEKSPIFADHTTFTYQKGDLVFLSESAAFPIYSIGSLADSRKEYIANLKKPDVIYQRHLDYQRIDDLRDILPPETDTVAMDMFKTSLLFTEALLLGIFKVDSGEIKRNKYNAKATQKIVYEPPPGDVILQDISFGSSVNTGMLRLHNNNDYHEVLKKEIEKCKSKFIEKDAEMYKKIMRLIHYYFREVFPSLTRGGMGNAIPEDSNLHLIIEGLRNKYIDEYKQSDGIDEIDYVEINKIDINEISETFEFEEKEAFADLRVLKI